MRRALSLLIVLCVLLNIGPIVSAGPIVSTETFTDVPSDYWAYNAIRYVYTNGYMNGVGNNQFNPSGVLSRAHIITVLHRVSQNTETFNYQPYSDVVSGTYYYTAVCWANSYSLSSVIQTSSTLFSPGSAVTRVKIAELVWKFAQTCGWATSAVPSITLPYTDIGNLTTTQKNALKWCKANAIMIGVTSTTFSPNTTITRAQFAQIVYNFDRYVATDRAFCVGTFYNDADGIDTSGDARAARDAYAALGYQVACVTVPTASIMQKTHHIKSNVLFFSGHANNNAMLFNYMQNNGNYKTGVYYDYDYNSSSGYKYVGIKGNMDFVKLAVFGGCNTAAGNDNIAKRAYETGALNSIGWTDEVYASSHTNWLSRFNYSLSCGNSVSVAIDYADSFSYLTGSHVKDHILYPLGSQNGNMVLNCNNILSATQSTLEERQDLNNILLGYDGNVDMDGEDYSRATAAIIQELDKRFQLDDYNINVYNTNEKLTTIDYTRVVGAFETDTGFTAIVNCGKLISLYDHTREISDEEINRLCALSDQLGIVRQTESERTIVFQDANEGEPSNEPKEVAEALQLALEKTQSSPQKEAAQQRYYYYYDVESGTASILVYTDYYFDGTKAMGVDLYNYKLDN